MHFLFHKHERRKHIVSASQVVLKELNFPADLNFAAPLTHEFFTISKGSDFADG